jgi:outer membrane protein assembly factor BamA
LPTGRSVRDQASASITTNRSTSASATSSRPGQGRQPLHRHLRERRTNSPTTGSRRPTSGSSGGINIGLLGQIHAGWQQTWYKAQIDTGSPLFPAESKDYNGWFASLDLDQTDRLYFPTKGWSVNTRYFDSQTEDYSKLDADLRGYTSLGDWVFATRLSYQGSPIGKLPYYDLGSLGGMLNMTAFAVGQLKGDDMSYGSVSGREDHRPPAAGLAR